MEAKHIPGPAAEAIANADAHLNDAGLTTYLALAEQRAELLAAAEEALRCFIANGHEYYREVDTLRAAIAKATGSQA